MKEIWKDVNEHKGVYQVSNLGRVRSLDRQYISSDGRKLFFKGKVLKPSNSNGYLRVNLKKEGKTNSRFVHRIVADAFIVNVNNCPQINHIDGNKENNNINNLEWSSSKDNVIHSHINNLVTKRKLSKADIFNIFKDKTSGMKNKDIGIKYNVSTTTITRIINRDYWHYIDIPEDLVRSAKEMCRKKLNDQEIDVILSMNKRGINQYLIANKLGISQGHVSSILKKHR